MDEHHSWYNGSVWHIDWPYQVYVGQWPIFYGLAILLHILKTIWRRNVVLGIMDQCDSKIDLVKYMWASDLYFMVQWFYLISLSDKLFLYIKKWHCQGVFVPLRALALVKTTKIKQILFKNIPLHYGNLFMKHIRLFKFLHICLKNLSF